MSFDFEAAVTAPFRMQPGLRRLAPDAAHLTPAAPGSRHQREKLAVLLCFAQQALVKEPAFDERPALWALAEHAAGEHPDHWAWDGNSAIALGLRVWARDAEGHPAGHVQTQAPGAFGTGDEMARCLLSLPPAWRLAALLALAFEDDLALVDGTSGHIPWLAVTLPSHWAPEMKVGRHFAEVHAPVADSQFIVSASARLVALVTAGERWERFVWSLTGHARLHAHPDRMDPAPWPDSTDPQVVAANTWWRTERQSFLPLPHLRQAVFTIRVQLQPFKQALAEPAKARRLHAALQSMSPQVLAYRGLGNVQAPLLAWLAERAAQESA